MAAIAVTGASRGIGAAIARETEMNAEAIRNGPLGAFLKARVPAGGAGSVQDVARLVAMLFSEEIAYLTGETIYLDGGQGIAH